MNVSILTNVARTFATPCTLCHRNLVHGGGRCTQCREARTELAKTHTGGRVYDTARWKHLRQRVLREEPYCRACLKRGFHKPARQIDHVVGLREGGDPYDRANVQPLCDMCHGAKTRLETLGLSL